jgi:hypothetical protein
MSEHNTPGAGPEPFDGDAISQADREFLASLSDHPLARHPLYSMPPPPKPDYDGCTTIDEKTEAQEACFGPALDWMLVNYAYYAGAFMGKGGIISLVDGTMLTVASMTGLMQPYTIVREGPKKGLTKTTAVGVWMTHPLRAHIDAIQCRADKPRPTYEEDGLIVYNRYWPPAHPTAGGEIKTFVKFLMRLVPDKTERKWMWHFLAHKVRKPWVPMVAIIMVAEEFGTGAAGLSAAWSSMFNDRAPAPPRFIGHSTWMSRMGSRPNRLSFRCRASLQWRLRS